MLHHPSIAYLLTFKNKLKQKLVRDANECLSLQGGQNGLLIPSTAAIGFGMEGIWWDVYEENMGVGMNVWE